MLGLKKQVIAAASVVAASDGAAASNWPTNGAAAMTCSKVSRIRSIFLPPSAAANDAATGSPRTSRIPAVSATFVGTLNEDFAIESLAGDIFQLGNCSLWVKTHEAYFTTAL